jgi:hypothetical protein
LIYGTLFESDDVCDEGETCEEDTGGDEAYAVRLGLKKKN